MTMFFIDKLVARGVGKRWRKLEDEENPHRLVAISQVIIIVGNDGEWITVKDRFEAHGRVIDPRRLSELLEKYTTITRPTEHFVW